MCVWAWLTSKVALAGPDEQPDGAGGTLVRSRVCVYQRECIVVVLCCALLCCAVLYCALLWVGAEETPRRRWRMDEDDASHRQTDIVHGVDIIQEGGRIRIRIRIRVSIEIKLQRQCLIHDVPPQRGLEAVRRPQARRNVVDVKEGEPGQQRRRRPWWWWCIHAQKSESKAHRDIRPSQPRHRGPLSPRQVPHAGPRRPQRGGAPRPREPRDDGEEGTAVREARKGRARSRRHPRTAQAGLARRL